MTAPFSARLQLRNRPARAANWTYVTQSTVGAVDGEQLPLGQVSYTEGMAGAGSGSGAFVYTDRRAEAMREATEPIARSIVAYRNNQAQWGGIIIRRQHDRSTRAVKLTVADWWWYFTRRRVTRGWATGPSGWEQNAVVGGILANVSVFGDIAAVLNLELLLPPVRPAQSRVRSYDPWSLTKVSDVLADYAKIDGGSDLAVTTTGTRGDVHRQLLAGAPLLGRPQEQTGLVLDSKRLEEPAWEEDGAGTATRWWSAGNGEERDMLIARSPAAGTPRLESDRGYPILEDYSSYKDVEQIGTLQAHADGDRALANGLAVAVSGSTRGVLPSDVLLGDEVDLRSDGKWWNRQGLQVTRTRITAKKVSIPDSGADERLTPVFGELLG